MTRFLSTNWVIALEHCPQYAIDFFMPGQQRLRFVLQVETDPDERGASIENLTRRDKAFDRMHDLDYN